MIVPPIIVILLLLLASKFVKAQLIYQGAALGALVGGFLVMLQDSFKLLSIVKEFPLYNYGFGWILFAFIGGLLGLVITKLKPQPVKETA